MLYSCRSELEQLRGSKHHMNHKPQTNQQPSGNQERNDHLTLKWLSTAMTELRTEMAELQSILNTTVLIHDREETDVEVSLLRTEVANLGRELEHQRNKHARYEAAMGELKEEVASLKEGSKSTAIICGNTKNQVYLLILLFLLSRIKNERARIYNIKIPLKKK